MPRNKLAKVEAELFGLKTRRPFTPFTMKFKNGESFRVLDAFQFAFVSGGDNNGIFLHPKRGITWFKLDQIETLRPTRSRKR